MAKKKLVILSGAGISAESGLRTFRDSDGLWEGYNVEDVATPEAWKKDPQLVLNFYNERRRNVADAKPNAAHIGLVDLENDFDVTVITQNIDDLHEKAGSTNVLHLHGEIFKMRSEWDDELISEIKGDIKRVVAWSSMSHVGLIAAGLFTMSEAGLQGGFVQMFNHGINVVGLFLVADILEKRLKTRDITTMGGIASKAPIFALLSFIIVCGAMAVPLTNGFRARPSQARSPRHCAC